MVSDTNCLKPVCEEVFDPVVKLAFNTVTGEIFQENFMVDFFECFGKVEINNLSVDLGGRYTHG